MCWRGCGPERVTSGGVRSAEIEIQSQYRARTRHPIAINRDAHAGTKRVPGRDTPNSPKAKRDTIRYKQKHSGQSSEVRARVSYTYSCASRARAAKTARLQYGTAVACEPHAVSPV
jgi:hypothetical protein